MSVILDTDDRKRIDNIRHTKQGRPLGMANLSDKVKAEIVGHKNLQILSQPAIAAKYNVSRQTVVVTNENSLSPEAKKHLRSFTDKLSDIREETAELILEKVRDKSIKDGVLPSLLNIANQNYRLETNQSTQNVQVHSYAQILINWANSTNADQATIDQKLTAIADANSLNLADLRAAVLGQTGE